MTGLHPLLIGQQYSGAEILHTWATVLFFSALLLLFAAAAVYYGEMYRLLPGWGPVLRFDSSRDDKTRLRQEVFAAVNEKATGASASGVWKKQEGVAHFHPVYGSVKLHPGFQKLQDERRRDPFGPRDEIALRGPVPQTIENSASAIQHRLV